MPGVKLQKRTNDFFISYGGVDFARVAPLVDLLRRVCGLQVWLDDADGNAATLSSELLANAIGNARGALFCLSESWKRSSWCKSEFEVSLVEKRANDAFEIVSLRLDDVEPPDWFNVAEIIDFREANRQGIARLLRSLASDVPHRFDNAEDVYLAAPWSRPSALAQQAFHSLRKTGWRLVGDTPAFKHLGAGRIAAMMLTTRGVVAILPHDPSQVGLTSPYIVEEARIALCAGKPLLLLVEPGLAPPEDIVLGAFRGMAFQISSDSSSRESLAATLEEFDESLHHEAHDDTRSFIFFAASLRGESTEADEVGSVIERSSNMRCVRGERVASDNVQAAIVDLIRRAALVIADVSDDHRNTLIEAGVAMGSGTKLKLICRAPEAGTQFKKRFMFEGLEYFWYRTPEERLGLCYYFARQFRRRVYVVR